MENFITGFPGHESQHRAAMRKVLGPEKYQFFFDKWLEYFFTDSDAKFFAELGLNCLRLPFNYRHFEDDMNPRVLKESGFKHLDRVIDLVRERLDLCLFPKRKDKTDELDSAHPMGFTPFWICMLCPVVRIQTGTLITLPTTLPFGITVITKTAQCGYGRRLLLGIRRIHGLLDTILSTSRATQSMSVSRPFTPG